jgi:hypothetical protein
VYLLYCTVPTLFFDLAGSRQNKEHARLRLRWRTLSLHQSNSIRLLHHQHEVRSLHIPGVGELVFMFALFLVGALFIMAAIVHYMITRKLCRGLLSTLTSHIHNKYRSSTLFHAVVSSIIGKFRVVFSVQSFRSEHSLQ